jgi:hypothetical protein
VGVFAEVEAFVGRHGGCGELTGGAEPPEPYEYSLWLTCRCGATMERWITPEMAENDLLRSSLFASPNYSRS